MSEVTIYCLCEGYSEQNFIQRMVSPALSRRGITVIAPMVKTRRDRKVGRVYKGGGDTFHHYKSDLRRLYSEHGQRANVYFTTLIDLYALPTDFPGYTEAYQKGSCYQKVAALEDSLHQIMEEEGIPRDRFIPHFELHEFETLLLVEPEALTTLFLGKDTAVQQLAESIARFENVEEINHTPEGAPSKRIEAVLPVYKKYKGSQTNGAINVAEVIGLDTIRQKCQHLNAWLERLEALSVE